KREGKFIGFSHFRHSGTGAIKVYYNYALTSPAYGDAPDFTPRELLSEDGAPGYYAARIDGIFCEAAVTERAALHRYTFDGENAVIAIDFAHSGLYYKEANDASCGKVTAACKELRAEMILHGVKWYFCARCDGATEAIVCDPPRNEPSYAPMVGYFRVPGGTCVMALTASTKSMAHAIAQMDAEPADFDKACADGDAAWNDALSKIEIDTEDDREREIFYSNFYHTLVKPCDFSGEAFLEGYGDGAFMADLATMWDIYKTQLPLIFTLYPEISEKIIATLARVCEVSGGFPHCLMHSSSLAIESNQARMLSEHSIADAYYRGIGADYPALLRLSETDAARFMDDLAKPGGCDTAAHTVDITCAHRALANVARELGFSGMAERFETVAAQYTKAYDGPLMKVDSPYYEGNRYNYSFRPTPEAVERIEKFGADTYKAELRRFFGYTDAEDFSSRFEGYNNESDMEAPAFCHYIDRDLYCEILDAGIRYMFTDGRGGLPGNNDSGGLSSCYIWNVLGLFPISGFDTLICGTPHFDRAVMHLPAGDLVIRRQGEGIYTDSVSLNGEILADFTLSAREMMKGGELVFAMKKTKQ
ncbi:MAG: glycoside hydrolase family 92 protein, partial [Ruminococcaceae bacterium]|nr:glycoside hydrolase family 92 protein [Oscillospiraceae bacterium]